MAHPVSPRSLAVAWLALVALATVSLLAPSGFAIPVAIAKTAIVAAVFMDLARGDKRHAVVFAIGLAFFALLVLGVAGDVEYR